MRARQRGARLLTALVVVGIMLTTLVATGRADPGEEPNLKVEIVGLKSGSKRDVVVRVSNVGEQWSDKTKLTVETISPSAGQRRTFDVPDINTVAEAPLPNSVEFTYTLAADCTNQVVKASLTAGTNYMGEKEIVLDDNVVQGSACVTPGQALQGPSLSAGAPIQTSPVLNNRPAPAPESPISIEWSAGPQQTFFVTHAIPYEMRIRNTSSYSVGYDLEIVAFDDARIADDMVSLSSDAWRDATGRVDGGCGLNDTGSSTQLECTSDTLPAGATRSLRAFVKLLAPVGAFRVEGRVDPHLFGPNAPLPITIERKVKIVRL